MRLLAVLLFPVVALTLLVFLILLPVQLVFGLTGLGDWVDANAKWLWAPVWPLLTALSVFGAWKVCARIWRRG
jgi:hypothetical protein